MPTPNPGHGAVLSGPAGSLLQQASFPFFSTLMQADSSAPLSRALPLLGVSGLGSSRGAPVTEAGLEKGVLGLGSWESFVSTPSVAREQVH